jgi:hypothetical protein
MVTGWMQGKIRPKSMYLSGQMNKHITGWWYTNPSEK